MRRHPLVYQIPALAHAGVIFVLSSMPAGMPMFFRHADKVAHMTIFGVLAFLVAWGVYKGFPGWSRRRVLVLALLAGIGYGAVDELHQYFVPTRVPEFNDLAADGMGAALAVACFAWLLRRARGRTPAGEEAVKDPAL